MHKINTLSITFLVTGTTIGAGVLALPIISGECGYIVSAIVAIITWAIMVFTGYILVDEYIAMGKKASMGAIYTKAVGSRLIIAIEIVYVVLFGALLTAYLSGIVGILSEVFGVSDRRLLGSIVWIVLLGIVSFGPRHVIRSNTLLVMTMLILFSILIIFCYNHSSSNLLFAYSPKFDSQLIAVFFGSFGFHGSIPAFCSSLNMDAKKSKRAIFFGTFIALIIYLMFIGTVLSCLPINGEFGSMKSAIKSGDPIIVALGQRFNNATMFKYCSIILSMLAIITSFIGVVTGLGQFVSDKFNKISVNLGRALAMLLPAIGFFWLTSIFVKAVALVGIGCGILFVVLPFLIYMREPFLKK